jgi:hypothetical protein
MSAGRLESTARLNPEFDLWVSGAKDLAKKGIQALREASILELVGVAALALLTASLLLWYFLKTFSFEHPFNIRRINQDNLATQAPYDKAAQNRVGLRNYLATLRSQGVPESHLVLTNFYVSTVNAAGLFFPAVDGVASPDAARLAVKGGARAFVFDLWPDLTPGANFGPTIQIVESGSLWRRTSLNALPFSVVLKPLIQEALELDVRPGSSDPVFLYLRFRGKPRPGTFTQTADVLRDTIEKYRLDASFNHQRAQATIFSMPIRELLRKVVVFSNVSAEGNALGDYINVGPREGAKVEWLPLEIRSITDNVKPAVIRQIQQNLSWVAPFSEDYTAPANKYDWAFNQKLGVQFNAMNFWNHNDRLKAYMAPDMFGARSFTIKPLLLRYVIEILPTPKNPQNPHWGSGPNAGSPKLPAELQLPL